jgi:hypothetical protein
VFGQTRGLANFRRGCRTSDGAVEPMVTAGGGPIINISSVEGMRGAPGL